MHCSNKNLLQHGKLKVPPTPWSAGWYKRKKKTQLCVISTARGQYHIMVATLARETGYNIIQPELWATMIEGVQALSVESALKNCTFVCPGSTQHAGVGCCVMQTLSQC